MTNKKGFVRSLVVLAMLYSIAITNAYAQIIDIETKEQAIARIEKKISETTEDSSLVFLHKELFFIFINDDLDKALFHIQESIKYALDAQMLDYVTLSYSDFGNTYTQKGNFEKAFESFETARSYNANLSSEDRSPFINFFMGRTWLDLQIYDLATIQLTNARNTFLSNRNKWLPKYELTRIKLYTGDTTAVLKELPILESEIPEENEQVNTDYLYHYLVLAELYASVNNIGKSIAILNRVEPYIVAHNRNYYRGILNYTYALIALKKEDFELAISYGQNAKTFFSLQQEYFYYMKSLKVLANAYSATGEYKDAYHYLSEYDYKNDAIQEAQHNAISTHLKSDSHTNFEGDRQLKLLQEQLKIRQLFIYGLILIIILIALTAFILSRSALDKNKIAKQLTNLNLDKNHFIGVVSHDLRSPLNSIMVLAEFMRDDPEMIDQETAKEYGSIMFQSSQQMQQLLNNMLDVNKIESNQTNITTSELDVLPLLKSNYESISILGKSKSIKTILEVPDSLPVIIGNQSAIIRILENLVSNAYKFSPMQSTVTIQAKEVGTQVEISITDQGPGLTELDKTKLFKKFEKLSASPTGNEKSTGLGLYIVKNLVQQLNGTILIESEQGKGTTFIVLFNKA